MAHHIKLFMALFCATYTETDFHSPRQSGYSFTEDRNDVSVISRPI